MSVPLRVLAFVPYPTGRVPGQRFRLEQWAPHLARLGIEVRFAPFLDVATLDVLYAPGHALRKVRATLAGHLRRFINTRAWGDCDVVWVYREATLLGPPWIERRVARCRPLVFEFDDAIWLPAASAANAWARHLKPADKTAEICRLARHVVVGNSTLAEFARTRAAAVSVVPSTIDTGVYALRARAANPRPVLGWTGSTTTVPYLEALLPALLRLRAEVDFELRVIGGQPHLPGLDVRLVPWRADSEADDLRPLDVGLMPLPDDAWSRGKCGMKALQYMALGIPPVVAPVGVNATLVSHGVSGFHARHDDEWIAALLRLIRAPELRARLGMAARATVEREFSAAVQAPRVAALLRDVAVGTAGGPVAPGRPACEPPEARER